VSAAWLDRVQSLVTNLARRGLLDDMPRTRDGFACTLGLDSSDSAWLESAPDFRLLVLEDPSRCLVATNDAQQTVLSKFELPPFWACDKSPEEQEQIREIEAGRPLGAVGIAARWLYW